MNTKPAAPPKPAQPPRAGSLKRFEALMVNDLGNPKLGAFVRNWAQPVKAAAPADLSIATIATKYLNRCLAPNANITRLSPDKPVVQLLEAKRPLDFLLIETSWVYEAEAWAPIVRSTQADGEDNTLRQLLAVCNTLKSLPTVLWFTLDEAHLDTFAPLVAAVDHVFAADPALIPRLERLARRPVELLRPAVEPTLNNPLFQDDMGLQWARSDFGICTDTYNELCNGADIETVHKRLAPALDHLFWIFETRFLMRNNNARLPKDYMRRFLGCFDETHRATFLKFSEIYLNMAAQPGRPKYEQTRNMLEAMASKALVIGNIEPAMPEVEGLFAEAGSADELEAVLAAALSNPGATRRMKHLAYRTVMEHHTYADRLRSIARTLGLPEERIRPPEPPLITAIVPTMRPELLPFVLNGYRRQLYPNLELVVVLHSDSYAASDIAPLLREDDAARVIRVPEDQAVGTALNVGIDAANGDYWARIDDDDYYGPHYFSDMMLNRKFYDFDICGKSQWFIYFEAFQAAFAHKKDWYAHSTNPAIAGGTFLVRNSRGKRFRFDNRVRGYADVDLIGREIDRGCKLVSSDPFNFLQIRRNDRKSHTWTADAADIRVSEKIADGLDLSRIAI